MSNLNDLQKQFVSQLNYSYENDSKFLLTRQKPTATQKRLGFKSITDQMRIVSHYVCECGTRMHEVEHSTVLSNDQVHTEDIYTLHCSNCKNGEKINFQMLTKYLRSDTRKSYDPRSAGFFL